MGMSYDDYLAHYGVKGMKWGRRKNRGSSDSYSSSSTKTERTPEQQAARRAKRKKLAIGVAAVVGTAAVVGVGAMSANKIQNGRKLAETVSKKTAETTIEDAVRKMQAGEKQKARDAQYKMAADMQARLKASAKAQAKTDRILRQNPDVSSSPLRNTKRHQRKIDEARTRINTVASKGLFDMAASTLSQNNYNSRARTKDVNRFGERGAKRIEKKVNSGVSLSTARRQELRRKGRNQMVRGAVNFAVGKR